MTDGGSVVCTAPGTASRDDMALFGSYLAVPVTCAVRLAFHPDCDGRLPDFFLRTRCALIVIRSPLVFEAWTTGTSLVHGLLRRR